MNPTGTLHEHALGEPGTPDRRACPAGPLDFEEPAAPSHPGALERHRDRRLRRRAGNCLGARNRRRRGESVDPARVRRARQGACAGGGVQRDGGRRRSTSSIGSSGRRASGATAPIYLVFLNAEGADRGTILFHATRPDLEGSNLWNSEDKNGVRIAQELIANAGRNFVEYYFDNPAVVGDEEEGSLKVAYPENLRIGGHRYVINCGFYPATVPVAPPFALLLLALVLGAGGAYRLAQGASAEHEGASCP